jgi:O-methyltransferase
VPQGALDDTRANRTPFHGAKLHRLMAASRMARALSIGVMARVELGILGGHKDPAAIRAIREARGGRESLLSGNEAFTVYSLARSQSALGGEMAEVGVYQGVSARLISTGSGGEAPLHLFDTFAGLPLPDTEDHERMREGHYAASLDAVQDYLMDRRNISYHRGVFPDTAAGCEDCRFSFVHLDVDLKTSTLDCLTFFYPRMLPGGVILSHDYSYLDEVRSAFTEFCGNQPENPMELATSQVMLVKR